MRKFFISVAMIMAFNFAVNTAEEIKEEIHDEWFFSDDDHNEEIDHFFD